MERRLAYNTTFLTHVEQWAERKNLEMPPIEGNISEEVKRQCWAIFRFFVNGAENAYGTNVGLSLEFMEANVGEDRKEKYAETMYEVTVKEDMCNAFQTLHGACAAYIVDLCSVSSLVVLGIVLGFNGTGVSQSMNLIWHQPIRLGEKVKIRSTSMHAKGRLRTIRCELQCNGVLCISAIHSVANPSQKYYDSIVAKL